MDGNLETRGKLSEDSRLEIKGNRLWQVLMKLMSNDEVDKLKLHHNEVDK